MFSSFFSLNGTILPIELAKIELDDIDFVYGYGVYETLKVRKGLLYFAELHAQRLFLSARTIGLTLDFSQAELIAWLQEIIAKSQRSDANVKILLIGRDKEKSLSQKDSDLYMMVLPAFFPPRTRYRDGSAAMLFRAERWLAQAKTLNMLASTIAFREAQAASAYDAILVNRYDQLTEGTRTNLFYTDGSKVYSPPKTDVLEGVTKLTLQESWRIGLGIEIIERALSIKDLEGGFALEGIFVSSTSTKLMPITRLFAADSNSPGALGTVFAGLDLKLPELGKALIDCYDTWLKDYALGEERSGKKLVKSK